MLMAAMLAMVLVVAAPAMAQDNTGGDQYATGCVAVQNAIQDVQAAAVGGDGGDASADIGEANQIAVPIAVDVVDIPILGVTGDNTASAQQYVVAVGGDASGGDAANVITLDADQYQDCESVIEQSQYVGDVVEDDDDVVTTTTTSGTTGGTASAAAASSGGGGGGGGGGGTLPATGGASLLALGAGALLVGGGLLARRIVR
jgi:hypothetical protein